MYKDIRYFENMNGILLVIINGFNYVICFKIVERYFGCEIKLKIILFLERVCVSLLIGYKILN